MIARRSVWADSAVQELLPKFVPAADEVGRLQRGKDHECLYFQAFAERGHYAGRTEPTNTRQGIYAIAPSGELLASVNTRRAKDVARMLEKALAAWNELPEERRLLPEDPSAARAAIQRNEQRFPEGGSVLRVTVRDLPRESAARGWRGEAWNEDWAWLKREDVHALCTPADGSKAVVGASWTVPAALARRIARAHLVDFVRGQTGPFRDEEIEHAELRATVEGVTPGALRLRLEGRSRASAKGKWSVTGYADGAAEATRGYDAHWLGHATFDTDSGTLGDLELVVRGMRWGGTQYNSREDDLEPAAMAFVFQLAHPEPGQRVAPAHLWAYGW